MEPYRKNYLEDGPRCNKYLLRLAPGRSGLLWAVHCSTPRSTYALLYTKAMPEMHFSGSFAANGEK